MYVEKTAMLPRLVSLLYFSRRAYIDLFIAEIERNETQNASKHRPPVPVRIRFCIPPFPRTCGHPCPLFAEISYCHAGSSLLFRFAAHSPLVAALNVTGRISHRIAMRLLRPDRRDRNRFIPQVHSAGRPRLSSYRKIISSSRDHPRARSFPSVNESSWNQTGSFLFSFFYNNFNWSSWLDESPFFSFGETCIRSPRMRNYVGRKRRNRCRLWNSFVGCLFLTDEISEYRES